MRSPIVFGTAYGGVMPLYAVLAREYFGPRIMGTVFGAATMVSSLGMAFGPWAGGWIFDTFDDYRWLYIGSLAVGLGAVAMALAFPPLPAAIPRKAAAGLNAGLQMAGAMVLGLAAGHRETDRGADRDPVGVFARDVAAVDHVDRENLVRPVAHAGLKSRPDHARRIRLARLAERLDGPLQGFGEFPVEADAIESGSADRRCGPTASRH